MKRSQLKRGPGPERRAPLRRTGFGKRGNRRRDPKPPVAHLPQVGCWPGQFFDTPCGGHVDDCHVGLDQQTLRRHWDEQLRRREWHQSYNVAVLDFSREQFVWLPCWIRKGCRDHHASLDGPNFKLERAQIPESVELGAELYGLSGRLTRDYGPREYFIDRFGTAA